MKRKLSYSDIYELDINLMNMILDEYANDDKAWKLFYKLYEDPDGYPIENNNHKMIGDIKCTVDGLLSVKRIKQHESGFGKSFVEVFKAYRKTPIMYFPCERNGINFTRSHVFGDRIDHTLFDIKRKCEGKTDCRLETAYSRPNTLKWLKQFNYDFKEIVRWLKIDGIFVDDEYKVFDLEFSDGTTIKDYQSIYDNTWSKAYYDNVKEKIKAYERKHMQ